MKTRDGFVSNSSSTSFTFIQKGKTKADLYKCIAEWHQLFELGGPSYMESSDESDRMHMNAADLIAALKAIKKESWRGIPNVISCKTLMKKLKEDEEYWKKQLKELREKEEKDQRWFGDDYMQEFMEIGRKINALEDYMEAGFKTALVVSIGDNHGHICDCKVGTLMDYNHHALRISRNNLVIWATSEH